MSRVLMPPPPAVGFQASRAQLGCERNRPSRPWRLPLLSVWLHRARLAGGVLLRSPYRGLAVVGAAPWQLGPPTSGGLGGRLLHVALALQQRRSPPRAWSLSANSARAHGSWMASSCHAHPVPRFFERPLRFAQFLPGCFFRC